MVQVKDSYGATATCGGTSAPDGVHACPTAIVDPFTGSITELLQELDKATTSVVLKQNLISSGDILTKTMSVTTAKGGKCPVRTVHYPSVDLTNRSVVIARPPLTSMCGYVAPYRSARQKVQFQLLTLSASAMK